MTETKRRIKELKALLPNVRERVISVALLLALSLTMMASASYAWYTLSFAPEATEITTTVSSNGSLEVALSDLDGRAPDKSMPGDSTSADGQTIQGANITWGNLINLSNFYGIENLTLRPAHFDPNSAFYLSSAKYGEDGRAEDDGMTNFAFTSWMDLGVAGQSAFDFAVSNHFGVRAISSVAFDNSAGESVFQNKMTEAAALGNKAKNAYEAIWTNTGYVEVMRDVVQIYLNHEMYNTAKSREGQDNGFAVNLAISAIISSLEGKHNDNLSAAQVRQFANMYKDFYQAVKELGEAWTYLANVHQYLHSINNNNAEYTDLTLEAFLAASANELKAKGVKINSTQLSKYKSLHNQVYADWQTLEEYANLAEDGTAIYLTDYDEKSTEDKYIYDIIDHLMNINSVRISKGTTVHAVSTLMGSLGTAYNFVSSLSNGDTIGVTIYNGDIKTFEEQSGARLGSKQVVLENFELIVVSNINGHMSTNATNNHYAAEVTTTIGMDANYTANLIAKDTYGMVLDLWFRTNAQNSVLTMDGLVTYETEIVPKKVVLSGESESREVYSYERPTMMLDKDTPLAKEIIEVYRVVTTDDQGKETAYYYSVDNRAIVYQYEVVEKYYSDTGEETTKSAYEADKALGDNAKGYRMEYAIVDKADFYDEEGNKITRQEYEENMKLGDQGQKYYMVRYPITADQVDQLFDELIKPIGFSGSNRVYDNLVVDSGFTSATQGSGSCFVFYADSPEEYTATKEMLSFLKIAFVDADRQLLANGYFDTEYIFEDSGKYIVPVVIETGVEYMDQSGNTCYGIYALEQNVPVRISAVIYLEGEGLENSMAMSDGAIQGNLNLQFGSSVQLNAWKDTDLTLQTVRVGASISDTSFEFDGNPITPKLTATIEGLRTNENSLVQAIFRRQITSSQGSRIDPITLTNTSGAVWEANCDFKLPGTYVLSSLWVDGVEYELPEKIVVEVSGFRVDAVSFCTSYEGEELALTADSSVSRPVSVKFNTALTPSSVVARIVSDDEKYVSANLTLNPSNGYWEGLAKFTTSGHYTIEYLVVSGEIDGQEYSAYYNLPESMQSSFTAYLGLRSRVILDNYSSDISFDYMGDRNIAIKMEITTDTGATMGALENVRLAYGKRGSSVLANGLGAAMKWDGTYYVGTFVVDKVGVFNFSQVEIGTSNIIRVATGAPTITARSMEPPVLVENNGADVVHSAGKNGNASWVSAGTAPVLVFENEGEFAYVAVQMKNIDSVNFVTLVMNTPEGEKHITIDSTEANGYFVQDDVTGVTTAYFKISTANMKSANGTWTVTEARIDGVYDPSGNYYGSDDENAYAPYYPLDVEDFSFNVLRDLQIALRSDVLNSGKAFLEAQSFVTDTNAEGNYEGIFATLTHTGFEFNDTLYIREVKLDLRHNHGSSNQLGSNGKNYGGYTVSDNKTSYSDRTVLLTNAGDGIWIVEANDANGDQTNAYLAGTYEGRITVTLSDGSVYSMSSWNAKTLEVYSERPVVKVTGTNPTPNTEKRIYSVKTPSSTVQAIQGKYFSFTDYSAIVYIHTPLAGNNFDQEGAEAYAPSVTLGLSGVPAGYSAATMDFTTANADSVSSTFSFTNGTATSTIGKAVMGVRGWFGIDDYPECYPAGRMTQNMISITYGDITYEVTLAETITIDNPQSPTVLNFAGIPENYTGTKPAQVEGVGTAVTVTLPELYWTATLEEPKNGTWSAYTAVGEVDGANTKRLSYTKWTESDRCGDTTYYTYQYYIWTKFQSSITASTDIFTQDKKIVKWKINGRTYKAGDTITVTGEGIISATAVVEDNGEKTFVETKEQTTYKYLYGYVAEAKVTKTETAPDLSVTLIGSPGSTETAKLTTPSLANVSNANAATDTPGTNTTTDPAAFTNYLP